MELGGLVRQVVDLLTPTISYLVRQGLPDDLYLNTYSIHAARRILNLLEKVMTSRGALKNSFDAYGARPDDEGRRNALESELRSVLLANATLAGEIDAALAELQRISPAPEETQQPAPGDGPAASEALRRLEMLKLLRQGVEPARIAERFKAQIGEVFRINYDYSVGGVRGAIIPESTPVWIDQLDGNDPFLRRLEMVRLLRAGTPAAAIARQFDALEDYVLLLGQRFAQHGLPGIMTDEDVGRFRTVNPNQIRICSYNLQGVRSDGSFRFRRMARELSRHRPDLIAFQEVVSGAGVDDTGGQIARWLSSMTGQHYRSHFTYCHQFMDKYPEGVAVCSRVPISSLTVIDLSVGLPKGLKPSMDRRAQMAETTLFGKKVILVSLHLDHIGVGEVRLAQAEKLLSELDRLTSNAGYYALILAGDFNDAQDSPALNLLKQSGFRDSYRVCHEKGGNTFAVPKPDSRIDYILVKGPAQVVSAEVILNNPDFSDHLGVFAVLR